MTTLFKIDIGDLVTVRRQTLASEEVLEGWIAKDPSIIGLDVLIIKRQIITDFNGRIVELKQPSILHDPDDLEKSDYIVGVKWHKTLMIVEAKTFVGAFANQNVVCKLRDPATLEFLAEEFGPIKSAEGVLDA